MPAPLALLDSFTNDFPASWRFSGQRDTLAAYRAEEVLPVIAAAEAAAAAGRYAVGFVAYEAAAAINPELAVLPPVEGLPLVWFAVFDERQEVAAGAGLPDGTAAAPDLAATVSSGEYRSAVEAIRDLIAAGDSYQVNYTFPLAGSFHGDPLALYGVLCRSQRAAFSALIDTGEQVVIAASPELFFSLNNGVIVTRPMKGTASRGRWPDEDRQRADALRSSEKERAENLMIVDLLRNDLGKIAVTGSVRVDSLFDIETYPTVHQMTSTISATVRDGVTFIDILRALFPCGSVTGAPKRRSMAIITEVERAPRGIYCGAIGCLAPGGEAVFSVAIRTLLLDKASGRVTMGVGSGITFDSEPAAEYTESLGKAAFLRMRPAEFSLLETMRLESGGYERLEQHLTRLEGSARYFGFPFDRESALRLLESVEPSGSGPLRVRLALQPDGTVAVTTAEISPEKTLLVVGISPVRIDPDNCLCYHKTSCRELFVAERSKRPDCSEVIFFNRRGELTEGSYNNILLRIGGRLLTPPLASGLLPGVLRGELLESGAVTEKILFAADLFSAEEIWLVNSLRGLRRAVLAEGESF